MPVQPCLPSPLELLSTPRTYPRHACTACMELVKLRPEVEALMVSSQGAECEEQFYGMNNAPCDLADTATDLPHGLAQAQVHVRVPKRPRGPQPRQLVPRPP